MLLISYTFARNMARTIPLHLASNASFKVFPENTNANFKNRLARPLRLVSKQYMVGLQDIQFSKTWKNVNDAYMTVSYQNPDNPSEDDGSRVVRLRSGRYRNIENVVTEAHKALTSFGLEKNIHLFSDTVRNVIFLIITDEEEKFKRWDVSFNDNMASILGFKSNMQYQSDRKKSMSFAGGSAPDLTAGSKRLYVYCSLAESREVGDVLAPLLRVIPLGENNLGEEYIEATQMHWVYANMQDTDIVEVNIRHGDGTPVAFEGGVVTLNVLLKPIET